MAGGPSTVELVHAASRAGSLGLLAGRYRTAHQLADTIQATRNVATVFGVNVFVPNPARITATDYAAYRHRIRSLGNTYDAQLPLTPREDDDEWGAKIDALMNDPVPVVSFTFGIPERAVVIGLRRRGTTVVQSVTSVAEALAAAEAGVDVVAVQAAAAGGHSAVLTPEITPPLVQLPELVAGVRASVKQPIFAAGGLAEPAQVSQVLRAGARAVLVGTALLRTPEAGTSAVHRAALAASVQAGDGPDTVITRAFTGRPARALRNAFVDRFNRAAPVGYPAIHHLTEPLRTAAAAAGDPQAVHLWAGVGYRQASERPAAEVLTALASDA